MQIPLKSYWALLLTYLKPQGTRAGLLAGLLLTSIGLQLIIPQILRYFIDHAMLGEDAQKLTVAAGLFLVVALANQALAVGATYMAELVGWTATNRLRSDLALHCLRLDLSFHKARTPGELIERIDGDITALANFFSQLVVRVLGNVILVLGVLVMLGREDWLLGAAFGVFVLATLVSIIVVQGWGVPYTAAARQTSAEFSSFVVERLSGTEDIRSNGATAYVMRRFYALTSQRLHREHKAGMMFSVVLLVVITMFTLGTAAAFALGAYLYRNSALTIGTIYLIVQYTEVLYRPLRLITMQMQDLQKASASIGRVQGLFGIQSKIQDDGAADLPAGPLSVAFEQVSFGYRDELKAPADAAGDAADIEEASEDLVLQGVTFRLQPGKVLGVLGRTGSGKTTLTRLLFRLYDTNCGAILLGDVDIRDARIGQVRQRVGMVTQDVQLFEGTIRDNLTLFDPAISDEQILAALRDLGLWKWFQTLANGLDTELAASGGLSAGEAQLLAFTRVFLKDPGLVILDEASSRLDPATEQLVERAVSQLLNNRTGIIIAHRLGTVHRADEILIMEDGRICEYGARKQLVAAPASRFYRLLQTGLEEALA